jgi:Polyketide cyclase / dehydrase and lipid transport
MYAFSVSRIVLAPLVELWQLLDDFAAIDALHPMVSRSRALGNPQICTGPGARRECELSDGHNWLRERIVEYIPLHTIATELYESSLPLSAQKTTYSLHAVSPTSTRLDIQVQFAAAGGLLGRLRRPLLQRRLKQFTGVLLLNTARVLDDHGSLSRAA